MTLQYDFALLSHSQAIAKNSYQSQLEKIMQFSIDAEVPFDQVLSMPSWLVGDFYNQGAWNIKKAHNDNRDQMDKNIVQLLANINSNLRNLR